MNDKKRVIYVDNVSTSEYIKNYSDVHHNVSKLTYVVFTEYERRTSSDSSYHGDIFFNGDKITYINDVDTSRVVTDGFDNFVAYVNNNGHIDFARSTILINKKNFDSTKDVRCNKYELFNTKNDNVIELSYEYVSDIYKYANEHNGKWLTPELISGVNNNITISNNIIKFNKNFDASCEIHLAYEFIVDDFISNEQSKYVSYAYVMVHNLPDVESLEFVNLPNKLSYNTILTPIVRSVPESAIQNEVTFTSSNTDVIKIYNKHTGLFRCERPGTATIYAYVNNSSTPITHKDIVVQKLNPCLGLTVWNNVWLDASQPNSLTNAYAHFDNHGFRGADLNCKWELYNGSNKNLSWGTESQSIRSQNITINDLTNNDINTIKLTINENLFEPNVCTIQVNRSDQVKSKTNKLVVNNYEYDANNSTISFVVDAISTDGGYVDTNYSFDNSIGLSSFVTTNITKSGAHTYTYVTTVVDSNSFNNEFIQSLIDNDSLNNLNGTDNTTITMYNVINVSTTDNSFKSLTFNCKYDVDLSQYISAKESNKSVIIS